MRKPMLWAELKEVLFLWKNPETGALVSRATSDRRSPTALHQSTAYEELTKLQAHGLWAMYTERAVSESTEVLLD